jgi:hypothetical protein
MGGSRVRRLMCNQLQPGLERGGHAVVLLSRNVGPRVTGNTLRSTPYLSLIVYFRICIEVNISLLACRHLCDRASCCPYMNRCFGETFHSRLRGGISLLLF